MHDVTQPPITREQVRFAGVVGANVTLSAVLLRSSRAAWNGGAGLRDDVVLRIQAAYETAWNIVDDTNLLVTLTVAVSGDKPFESGGDESALLDVFVSFDLVYHLIIGLPPEDLRTILFDAFAAVNGPYNGWPYVREFVDDCVRRMGLSRGTLPLFRLPRYQAPSPGQKGDPEDPEVTAETKRVNKTKEAPRKKKRP